MTINGNAESLNKILSITLSIVFSLAVAIGSYVLNSFSVAQGRMQEQLASNNSAIIELTTAMKIRQDTIASASERSLNASSQVVMDKAAKTETILEALKESSTEHKINIAELYKLSTALETRIGIRMTELEERTKKCLDAIKPQL